VRLLLDTHAFICFIGANPKLSATARQMIEDPANQSFVSIASLWEMAIKTSLGRMDLAEPFETLVPRQLAANGFSVLGITLDHLIRLIPLPRHHGDPFDRILVVQSMSEKMRLVSRDEILDLYRIDRVW
jgi:PIN domain nuclease of toxin-antitoxin system